MGGRASSDLVLNVACIGEIFSNLAEAPTVFDLVKFLAATAGVA